MFWSLLKDIVRDYYIYFNFYLYYEIRSVYRGEELINLKIPFMSFQTHFWSYVYLSVYLVFNLNCFICTCACSDLIHLVFIFNSFIVW